jgi:hypothetical protein
MPFAQSLIGSASMLAATLGGTIIFAGAMLGIVLAAYAIYWIIFKMGKD